MVTGEQQVHPTLDEVIAHNVHRLRKTREFSVVELAEKLGVGRHAIYDYERPRGERQHAFRWSELVQLCAALECSLYELVLPPQEVKVDVPRRVAHGRRFFTKIEDDEGWSEAGWSTELAGRQELSWMLFHMDDSHLGDEQLAILGERLQGETERRRIQAQAVAEQVWELLEDGKPDFIFDPTEEHP